MAASRSIRQTATLVAVVLMVAVAGGRVTAGGRATAARAGSSTTDPETKLRELNIHLPKVAMPVGNYVGAVRAGNLLFLGGAGPQREDGSYLSGRLGDGYTVEQGYEAARSVALSQLASLKSELGHLNRVRRVVKVFGMVNSAPGFSDQPKVINGFSDLLVQVFGARGRHARSAVGMAALPFNIPVEVEMIVEVR